MANNGKEEYINNPLLKKDKIVSRSYQQTIFTSCIGKNCMVVLPTARGKTIIALMLSVLHISEDADNKIIFLAPTKPLVVQHQKSYLDLTVFEEWQLPVLTGSVNPEKREKQFLDAKVAFMTPQVLQNDLINKRIDLSNVALIVFDEAHRAVGDYAYTFVAEVYAQNNPSGQILAMSASPGGTKEKIDEVCSNLKINHVEIRTNTSADVAPYVHKTDVQWIKLEMPQEYMKIKTELENLLRNIYKKLNENNFLDSYNINKISRKDLLSCSKKIDFRIKKERNQDNLPMIFAMKKYVSNGIRISHMLELLEAQGIESLNKYFEKSIAECHDPKSSKSLRELFQMESIRISMHLTKKLIDSGFIHPKLEKLSEITEFQFLNSEDSRILIFANFRDTINSIVDYLGKIEGIRPKKFVGQASRKIGGSVKKGMSQKEQIATLEEFKEGVYNVLVATSVAEEGLDIAECDLIIFYDVVPSEIRTIQRRGRTGRKREGNIIILMTKGTREEGYYWASKKREREMNKELKSLKKSNIKIKEEISIKGPAKGGILDYIPKEQKNSNPNEEIKLNLSKDKDSESNDNNFSNSDSNSNPNSDQKSNQNDSTEKYITPEEFGGTSQGLEILVDNRETQGAVVRHLALGGIDMVLKNLPVGDYILTEDIGIERKEAMDFNQSIMDGRIFDELFRLKENFEVPILIIEGNPVGKTGISKAAILGALASIVIKLKITVMYTEDAQETADIIIAFTKKCQEKKVTKSKIFKKKTGTIAEAQENIIGGVPGINLFRAQSLLSHFSNIKNIFNAEEDELMDVAGVGKNTAKKIKQIAENDYNKDNE